MLFEPADIKDQKAKILVIGVGNPIKGTFLDGQNSKQDASTLRQIALRLNGTYHDGNVKHIPSKTITSLVSVQEKSAFERSDYLINVQKIFKSFTGSRIRFISSDATLEEVHEQVLLEVQDLFDRKL